MKLKEFLSLVAKPGRNNYTMVAPDLLLPPKLLLSALQPIARPEDFHVHYAPNITKEKARQIEEEAHYAPQGGSALQHFFIWGLQDLPSESAGPLLKTVEEAKSARFIFQTTQPSKKTQTLLSRSFVVRMSFLSNDVVLANLQAMRQDAKIARELKLCDGTLGGTIRNLGMKDTLTAIRREIDKGQEGIPALYHEDTLNSLAFPIAMQGFLSRQEEAFIDRNPTHARKKVAIYLAALRK